ncbi:MAG: DNA-binding protein [Gammaproteobacteria bacterium]
MAISQKSIIQAINTLQSQGTRPTTFALRDFLGEGSLAAINAVLREWQQTELHETTPPQQMAEPLQQLIHTFSADLQKTLLELQSSHDEQLRSMAYAKLAQSAQEQNELAVALDRLLEERQQLQQKNQALQKQLSSQDSRLQDALREAQLTHTRADTIADERDRLLKELQAQRQTLALRDSENNKLAEAKHRLQAQLDTQKNSLEMAKSQLAQLVAQARELQQQRDEQTQLRNRIEAALTRAEQGRPEKENALKLLTAENQQFKQTIATLERQHNILEREYQQSRQQAEHATARADTLTNERDRLLAETKSLHQKIDLLEKNNLSLTENLARYRTQAEQEKTSHQQTRQHLSVLEQQLSDLTKHLDVLSKQRLVTENRAGRLDEDIQRLRADLREELHELIGDRQHLQQKLEDEHSTRIDAQKTIADLRVHAAQQETEMRKLALDSQQQIAQLQARINELETDLQVTQTNYRSQFVTNSTQRED